MTVPEAATLTQALAQAERAGLTRLDAQLLLLHTLGRPHERAWLVAHDRDPLAPAVATDFAALCKRRLDGEPVAYLCGEKEFFGLRLRVDARVLVPRPETEILVEWALSLPLPAAARVIDLGTGSGAIALALKQARPGWQLSAVDASAAALEVARSNGQALGLAVAWQAGDWLAQAQGPFDLIVSNPPYIAEADPHLAALRHEPRMALSSGPQGLDALSTLITQAPAQLAPGGWLLLEHGYDQAAAVRELLRAAGLSEPQSRLDLAGIERCSGARRPAPLGPAGEIEQG
jgi:release factor glutamine methyltransferase